MMGYYKLNVLPTEQLLKMIDDYFTDTAINIDNYSYDELITSCILATFTNGTTTSIGVTTPDKVKSRRLEYLNNNELEYLFFDKNETFYSNIYVKYNVHKYPNLDMIEHKFRKMHIKKKDVTTPFYKLII